MDQEMGDAYKAAAGRDGEVERPKTPRHSDEPWPMATAIAGAVALEITPDVQRKDRPLAQQPGATTTSDSPLSSPSSDSDTNSAPKTPPTRDEVAKSALHISGQFNTADSERDPVQPGLAAGARDLGLGAAPAPPGASPFVLPDDVSSVEIGEATYEEMSCLWGCWMEVPPRGSVAPVRCVRPVKSVKVLCTDAKSRLIAAMGDVRTRQQGIVKFNKAGPRAGVAFLQDGGVLGRLPGDVAVFLSRTRGLDKDQIGLYLCHQDPFCGQVLVAYMDAKSFTGRDVVEALRILLRDVRPPAEFVDRLLLRFAERYLQCNPAAFDSVEVVQLLATCALFLNTVLHNPTVPDRMSRANFVRHVRGIDALQHLTAAFFSTMYDRIRTKEIKAAPDFLAAVGRALLATLLRA